MERQEAPLFRSKQVERRAGFLHANEMAFMHNAFGIHSELFRRWALRSSVFLALVAVLGMAPCAYAQEPRPLSLDEAVTRAQENSFPVRSAAAQEDAVRAQKRQSLAVFFPRLTAKEQFTATTDPVNAFGFKLKQERFTSSDFQIGSLNDPERIDNFNTQLEVQQPILNLDGIYQRRAAADAVRAASSKRSRTEEVIGFRVKQGYFGLVLAERRLEVIDKALEAARANRDQAQNLFDQGIVNRADLLAARVRVLELESQRTEANAGRRTAADQLRFLMGMTEDVRIEPTDELTLLPVQVDTVDVARVNQTRSDMQALRFRMDAAQEKSRSRWMAFVPKLNALGRYQWNDEVAFGTMGSSWTAGASLTWSVFQGFEQIGKAQQAEAEEQRAAIALEQQSVQNEVEIADALRQLRAARQRVDQTEAAVNQAEESLRIRSDRFAEGMARTTDVLQAEAQLANRRLAFLQALYDHTMALYRLELLTEQSLAP